MVAKKDLSCWEITRCERSEGCLARQHPDQHCWEVASELADYRSAFNVCKDCLVYLSKKENSSLSDEDISAILQIKGVCVLASHCPQYLSNDEAGS